MYRALYRKWRPALFADVVGQASIVDALQNQLLHDKVGHAYLLTGTRGTGKTSCAKIFAKAVNCESRNGADPCGQCAICKGIDDGSVMDVVEIDAASNNGVDNIRELRDETAYTPSAARYKVYIIDEVHMLSTAAFNALLKIMEEPPSHVIFILATTEIHKVPATILSRCQRYDFARIIPVQIAGRLQFVAQQEGIALEDDAAQLIARLADGAMRDALSILDTCAGVSLQVNADLVRRMAGVTDKTYLFGLSDAVAQQDSTAALTLVAQLRQKSIDIKRLCDELILHYRNLLLAGVAGTQDLLSGVSAEEEALYLAAAQNTQNPQAIRAIQALCAALDKMGKGTDPRIELELALFLLCQSPVQGQATGQVPMAAVQAALATPSAQAIAVPAQPPLAAASVPMEQPPQKEQPQIGNTQSATQNVPWETDAPHTPPAQPAAAQPPVSAPVPSAPVQLAQAPSATESQGAPQPFAPWPQVLESMRTKDGLLFANLNNSKAYLDGKRVLIDGSDLFLEYMRKNEFSATLIKQTIAEVTGIQCGIGPYLRGRNQEAETDLAQQSLTQLEQMGVTVVYEDE